MSTPAGRPFGTLLVANRGEIALRVIRSAQALGLRTVAVYSSADRESPHVTAADTAVLIGPAPAAQSYLSVEAVIRAAEVSGAEAVHPGYGFLSERADFARAVVDAGLVFVGPSAAVVEQMGRKDHARELAERAGVPVLPVFADADGVTAGDLPVLVKAAAGGGGKGMRIVQRLEDLPEAVAAARREAAAAFGDDTLLVERFVERGRHVEVQVIGDDHGNVRHLYERDCSTQRRHQKVVEEAPAPTVDDALRDRLTAAAVALAREVGYVNAGTVEFLVDESDGQAYFLEMNTRLQVEHPVTEAVVRVGGQPLDLVALQLAVAMGEELPFGQDDVRVSGHAIETRVYAEDPYAGHLPQAGTATAVSWSRRARVESALRSGSVVTSHYDPMIAKVVVRGPDREAARQLMIGALDESNVLGLTTNLGHLRELVASDAFRDCAIDTRWLDRHPDLVSPPPPLVAEVFAAWAVADDEIRQRAGHPFGTADGWRLSGPAAPAIVELVRDGEPAAWTVSWRRLVGPDGQVVPTRLIARDEAGLRLEVDRRIETAAVRVGRREVEVSHRGHRYRFARPDAFAPDAAGPDDGTIGAPMPGTVVDVRVEDGQEVQAGDVLGVLEAMKMELSLKAPFAGTVTKVAATPGDQVALGATLFVVEGEEQP